MSDEDKGRGDKSSKLVKLIRRLSSDQDDEVLTAVRLIRATLKSRCADIHDLADSIQKLEENGAGANAEFYKKAWLDGYSKGAEDERKKMPRNAAIGFGAADSDELTCEAAVLFAHQYLSRLNSWERNFIEDMAIQMRHAPSKSFSEKQTALIFKIYRRAGGKI
ncbi:hypothetical protein [Bradyrhizobium sp. Ai1a-2]|uniref:hypothetical protein n=1 Tax=Bradyrhizobium sp. Ai1a-2 TaxID=196490 RepID=UPI0004271173|nr:hypothetical protein [Bradyrhizobium sp. Ai1a-2]